MGHLFNQALEKCFSTFFWWWHTQNRLFIYSVSCNIVQKLKNISKVSQMFLPSRSEKNSLIIFYKREVLSELIKMKIKLQTTGHDVGSHQKWLSMLWNTYKDLKRSHHWKFFLNLKQFWSSDVAGNNFKQLSIIWMYNLYFWWSVLIMWNSISSPFPFNLTLIFSCSWSSAASSNTRPVGHMQKSYFCPLS